MKKLNKAQASKIAYAIDGAMMISLSITALHYGRKADEAMTDAEEKKLNDKAYKVAGGILAGTFAALGLLCCVTTNKQ